ncbi:MAG: hypothetical protein RR290_01365 [Clostridia bacterium]
MNAIASKKKKGPLNSVIFRGNIEYEVNKILSTIENGNSKLDTIVMVYWPDGSNFERRVYTMETSNQIAIRVLEFNKRYSQVTMNLNMSTYNDGFEKERKKISIYISTN